MCAVLSCVLALNTVQAPAQDKTVFRDARLTLLYDAALKQMPAVQIRAQETERARAAIDSAKSRLGIQASWSLGVSQSSYSNGAASQDGLGYRATLSVRKPLYDRALETRIEGSEAVLRQKTLDEKAISAMVAQDLFDRILHVLEAEAEMGALAVERTSAVKQADRLKVMRERQLARATEVAEINAYVSALNTKVLDAQNARRAALDSLSEIVGAEVESVLPLSAKALPNETASLRLLIANAHQTHPRILALLEAVEASRKSLAALSFETRPTIAAVGTHVNADQGFDNISSGRYRATSLGLEIRVPIYEGGRIDASLRDALAAQRGAELQVDHARREIERDIRKAYLAESAARMRIESTLEEVSAMEQASDAQEKGYSLGVSTLVELLEAHKRLHRAYASLAKARLELARSLSDLRISSGSFSASDLSDWDSWFQARN
jgi:outer membrane protein